MTILRYRFRIMFVLCCGVLVALAGCSRSDGLSAESQPLSVRDTYEEHDHDTPAHFPESFPAAVDDLARRHDELTSALVAQVGKVESERFRELRDIAGWLPRLAADSDLSETEWLPVNSAATRIQAAYETLSPIVEQQSKLDPQPLLAKVAHELPTLKQIAESNAGRFEVTPHEVPKDAVPSSDANSDDRSKTTVQAAPR
jgi:hypothetical protein